MAKGNKKRKKNQSFHQAIKPFIKDTRVLYALLGAVGTGIALATLMGREKGKALADKIMGAAQEWGPYKMAPDQKFKSGKKNKPPKATKPSKKNQPVKPFALEDI